MKHLKSLHYLKLHYQYFYYFILCIIAHVIASWADIFSIDIEIQHKWLFKSVPQLMHEVYWLNFTFSISLYLFFRIFLSQYMSLFILLFSSFGFILVSESKVHHLNMPLLPWDFYFYADLLNLIKFKGINSLVVLSVFLIIFVLFIVTLKAYGGTIKRKEIGVLSFLLGIIPISLWLTSVVSGQINKISRAGIHNITWDQKANFYNYGPFYTFVINLQFLQLSTPTSEILLEVDEVDKLSTQASILKMPFPDVVMILSESFTDLPIKIFNQPFSCLTPSVLTELDTPAWGGFTANVEFEVLTGYPFAIFPVGSVPYQMYVKKPVVSSLPNQFVNNGYDTSAIHTFQRDFFSRPTAYTMLGISKYVGLEDLVVPQYRGQYVSDEVIFDEILNRFTPEKNQPQFIHAVTMMAHLPYDWIGRYPINAELINSLPDALTGYKNSLLQYGSIIYDHEAMLCSFLDKLKKRKKRTIVVFYGDHYPSFGSLSVYERIHKHIYIDDLKSFNLQEQYSRTPLFMFDSEKGFVKLPRVISAYNLGSVLLHYIGLSSNSVWEMPHKRTNRSLVRSVYMADAQNSKLLGGGRVEGDHEFKVLKAHAYRHLLSK